LPNRIFAVGVHRTERHEMPSDNDSFTREGTSDALSPLTVTIAVARQISGLGNTTVWKLISDGTLQSVTVGRRRLVVYQSLRRLLSTDAATSAEPPPRRRGRPRKVPVAKAVTS
jgi:hypothetical protein